METDKHWTHGLVGAARPLNPEQNKNIARFFYFPPDFSCNSAKIVYSIDMIRTKNVKKDLLRFRHDELDGQDYETAANLIGGNQFIAAANFIDRLDTMPREHMMTLIYKNKKLWNEMWYFDEIGQFCTREAGVFSEFAEEGLAQ